MSYCKRRNKQAYTLCKYFKKHDKPDHLSTLIVETGTCSHTINISTV